MSGSLDARYVLDASIAMKWYLPDEVHAEEATNALPAAFSQGHVTLLVPHHIYYEVANALRTAVNRGRVTEENARRALDDFLALELPAAIGIHLIGRGWNAAKVYSCAFYDGLYLALAEMLDAPLIHADRRLAPS